MFCRNCGNQLPGEAKFCNKCGTQVKSIPVPPVEEEAKQETTIPVTAVTPQPAPAVEQTPLPKVEVVQTPVVEQTPPAREIIEPTPVPAEPEPVPNIPEPIPEPEPISEPEPPVIVPVIPETIPAADPPKSDPMQVPPVVETPAAPDPVPVAETVETPVEPAVTITKTPTEEPDKTVPDNRCPNCQSEITPGVKFCPECGTKADHIPASPVKEDPTPPITASNPESTKDAKTTETPPAGETPQPAYTKTALFLILAIIAAVCFFIANNTGSTRHGLENKTEDMYIAAGLELVGEPTWDIENNLISIKGKVKATNWIGSQVVITATFYDKDGAIMLTRGDTIADLQAGDVWAFEIIAYNDGFKSFTIDGIYY